MKRLMKNKKALILVILSMVLLFAIAMGGTLAYFTDFDEETNTFTLGKVKIELAEPNWDAEQGLELRPGNVLQKDPTVTAKEGQSYMRVRMEIVDGEGNPITAQDRIDLILETLYYDTAFGTPGAHIQSGTVYETSHLESLAVQNKINKEYNRTSFAFAGIATGTPNIRYYNYIANGGIFDGEKTNPDTVLLFSNTVIPGNWHNKEIFALNGDVYEVTETGGNQVTVPGTGYRIRLTAEAVQSSDMADAASAFASLNEATGVTIDPSGA